MLRCLDTPDPAFNPLQPNPASAAAPHRVFDIGNAQPVKMLQFIALLDKVLGQEAIKMFDSMQTGEVEATTADTPALDAWLGFGP